MNAPKVSIIWLNYNSMKFMNIVLESLKAVADLDYPNDRYELIVVDNGSTDGSFEKIRSVLEQQNSLRKKIVKLSKNLGFTGGINVGFSARNKDTRYVVLLNNDAVPEKDSLLKLIEYAEYYNGAVALNGVLLRYGSNLIDTAGDFIDELLRTYPAGSGKTYPWMLKKPFYVSYCDGAYAIYKVENVRRCVGEKLFINEFFGYGDDHVLGLMLWDCGYPSISVPKVVGYHLRGSTFGRVTPLTWYLSTRNRVALTFITNSRYKGLILKHSFEGLTTRTVKRWRLYSIHIRSLYDGISLGRMLLNKMKIINIYRAPLISLKMNEVLDTLVSPRRRLVFKMERKIRKLISVYSVDRCDC